MDLSRVTPLLITLDERDNLPRTLAALGWAVRIVAVDSGSTDGTLELLRADRRIELLVRRFDTFADQCAHGLVHVRTPWVLSLDADHVVTPELRAELQGLDESVAEAWEAPFRYCIAGRPLRGSLLPPRIVLFRADRGRFENDGHGHAVRADGRVGHLNAPLLHDDRKPHQRWRWAQRGYAAAECAKLRAQPWRNLNWPDRLRRLYLGPVLVVPYCLFVKGLILDGRAGLTYTAQRLTFEALLAAGLMGLTTETVR